MKLVVENLTGTLFFVEVPDDAKVSDLKREIEQKERLSDHYLVLVLDDGEEGRLINDQESEVALVDLGFKDSSHVYLFIFQTSP